MSDNTNIKGLQFGRWRVLKADKIKENGGMYWMCQCSCKDKTIRSVCGYTLKDGSSQSCGCLTRERTSEALTTHGLSHTRIDKAYKDMKARCYKENRKDYHHYGGRGIGMCDEWLNNKPSFFQWSFDNGYDENMTLDRINVGEDYSPENCRWVDWKTQQNNKRSNTLIEIDGITKTLQQWSDYSGVNRTTISARKRRGIVGKDLIKPPWTLPN